MIKWQIALYEISKMYEMRSGVLSVPAGENEDRCSRTFLNWRILYTRR